MGRSEQNYEKTGEWMQSLQPRGVHGQPQYVRQVFSFPDGKAPDSAGAGQFWTPAADDDWTQLTHAMAATATWKAKRIGASLHQRNWFWNGQSWCTAVDSNWWDVEVHGEGDLDDVDLGYAECRRSRPVA